MPRIRPSGLHPPKVWQLIEIMDKDEKSSIKFTIQEIPEDRYEDAVQYMCTHFLADEPICQCLNAKNDPLFVQDISAFWRLSLAQGISIAAFIDNPDGGKPIIVAINVLGVEVNSQRGSISHYQFKSEKCKKTLEIISNAKKKVLYKRFGFDKYLYANGLSTHPDYRGYGLGKNMLKISKSHPIIESLLDLCTASRRQSRCSHRYFRNNQPAKAGYEEYLTKNFSDLVDKDEEGYFSDTDVTLKIMGKRLL